MLSNMCAPTRLRRGIFAFSLVPLLLPLAACGAQPRAAPGYHIEAKFMLDSHPGIAWVDYQCRDLGPKPYGIADRALDDRSVRVGGTTELRLTLAWRWIPRGSPCPPTYVGPSSDGIAAAPPLMALSDRHDPLLVWFFQTGSTVPLELRKGLTVNQITSVEQAASQSNRGESDKPQKYRSLDIAAPYIRLITLREKAEGTPNTFSHPLWKALSGRPSGLIDKCEFLSFPDLAAAWKAASLPDVKCSNRGQGAAADVLLTPRYLAYASGRVWRIEDNGGGSNEPAFAISLRHPDCHKEPALTNIWAGCVQTLQIDSRTAVPIANVAPPYLVWRQPDKLLFLINFDVDHVLQDAEGERK